MSTDLLWHLAYHVGGPTTLATTDSEPLGSLPVPIRTAVLKAAAEDSPDYLEVQLEQRTLWFAEGSYDWVSRWAYRDSSRRFTSADAFFRAYQLERPLIAGLPDEHFAERQFVEQVFVPVLGLAGLEHLHPQEHFTDLKGVDRHIDFVLSGLRRYAIEIEGASYHEEQRGPDGFRDEKLRQRSLVQRGYHYFPFAWTDLEAGRAKADLESLARDDVVLAGLLQRHREQSAVPVQLQPLLEALPQRFPDAQCLVLHLLRHAVSRGRTRLSLVDAHPVTATFTLAVLDTVALVERVAALYGLSVQLPTIELSIVGPAHATGVTSLLRHYLGDEMAPAPGRLDAPATPLTLRWVSAIPANVDLVVVDRQGTAPTVEGALTWPEVAARARTFRETIAPAPMDVSPKDVSEPLLDYFARRFFRVPELKREQSALVARALRGEPGLGILPTGFGKSIVFQLAALLLPRPSVVISPLKALIRDQVFNLKRVGITNVAALSSSDTRGAKELTLQQFCAGAYRLLYISPERTLQHEFVTAMDDSVRTQPLGLFIVDEAHCVSEWGHDFRPAYLQLSDWRRRLETTAGSSLPTVALTATASNLVRDDVLRVLDLPAESVVQLASSDRPTLSLSVHAAMTAAEKDQLIEQLVRETIPAALSLPSGELLPENGRSVYPHAGVVFGMYAAPKAQGWIEEGVPRIAEQLRAALNGPGTMVRSYASSGSDARSNESTQDEFQENRFPLLVATKGYGMGIDKRNIRFVIHHALAGGLEGYYQEAGRAGRDERHAHVALVYAPPHPDCRSTAIAGSEFPSCAQGRSSRCPYRDSLCDYGHQALFVKRSYPGVAEDVSAITKTFKSISAGAVLPASDEAEQRKIGLALYRLQQLGVVERYTLDYRRDDVVFHVTLAPSYDGTTVRQQLQKSLVATGFDAQQAMQHLEERLPAQPVGSALALDTLTKAATLLVGRVYERVLRMRFEMLRNLLEYAESDQDDRCRRGIIRTVFDPEGQVVPDDYRCEFCDVCVPDLQFRRDHAVVLAADAQVGELAGALSSLFDSWEPQALDELVAFAETRQAVAGVFMRATHRLEQDATNLAALYLAGALGRRRSGRERQALDYLRFGFTEGVRQGLTREDLLRFYAEGAAIDPAAALGWLTAPGGLWDNDDALPSLIAEAEQQLGTAAPQYRSLATLYRARKLGHTGDALLALAPALNQLCQALARPSVAKDNQ